MASFVDEYIDNVENDDVFPCKGCGEILEEGKAFELAGNRWHLDCFRCNNCTTLLDSDANLLLLGDGSLICNNCTYSCTACGNKIEDLAILTGDQAFCSTCFRCRNCKRKIENLRYARTSQGIFCMNCHESLMARRRKRSKAAAAAKAREKEHSPMVKEKSLPALPPNAIPNGAFSDDRVDPDSDTPTELSPRPRPSQIPTENDSRGTSRSARSPERQSESSKSEGLGLPSAAYRKNRNSTIIPTGDGPAMEGDDGFMISVALDPSPIPTPVSPLESAGDSSKNKDYFGASSRPSVSDKRAESHSSMSTPHIAFQEKGRKPSAEVDASQLRSSFKISKSLSLQEGGRPSPLMDEVSPRTGVGKLPPAAESLHSKQSVISRSSSGHSTTAPHDHRASNGMSRSVKEAFAPDSRKASEATTAPRRPTEDVSRRSVDLNPKAPGRTDPSKAIARKEVARTSPCQSPPASRASTSDDAGAAGRHGSARPSMSEQRPAVSEKPQVPPPRHAHGVPGPIHIANKDSANSRDAVPPAKTSPALPRWSSQGDFSMDEDMARILGTDEPSSSLLRRVSNAVRHGRTGSTDSGVPQSRTSHARSVSETLRSTPSPRWSRTALGDDPSGQHVNLGSPPTLSSGEDAARLKRQLRNSEQRVAELEKHLGTEKDLRSLNKKLFEKRKTVSTLDSQTEIMIRQLEVLAGYVERAKETQTPVDPRDLEDSALREFVQKLEHVKASMAEDIAQLHEERGRLAEERDQAMADRDRALMEFEQLSLKNAQLADMNNEMAHQIQGRHKSHQMASDARSTNGLGIYSQNKAASGSSANLETASLSTGPTLIADEEPIVESGPTVIQVRKGQIKKFNWKKGGKSMAQGLTKGVNRAAAAFQNDRPPPTLASESIGVPYNSTTTAADSPGTPASAGLYSMNSSNPANLNYNGNIGNKQQSFGFFGKKAPPPKTSSAQNIAAQVDVAEPPTVLFGSDLTERADYERRQIPNIVTRCIEEVELRGMDQEGIYRKTGGNSQVTMIKDGLDKNQDYDISDPDLDITAVTSVLKQYFRKLPTPLISFDVYERVLESTAIADEAERCTFLRKTFAALPQRHRDCLEFLMFHLTRVAQREQENLMSPKNLAVVFAPTIMRDASIEREMSDMHAKNLAIQFVVENSQTIFDDA